MATKRIIAYVMHESELAEAHRSLSNATGTESFVIGDVDESEIPRLEREGLIVEEVDRPRTRFGRPERRSRVQRSEQAVAMGTDAVRAPDDLALDVPPAGVATTWIVDIDGPLLSDTRNAIGETGARLTERIEDASYLAVATPQQAAEVLNLAQVTDVNQGVLAPPAPTPTAMEGGAPAQEQTWDVVLPDADVRPALEAWLAQRGVRIVAAGGRKVRFVAPADSNVPDEVAVETPGARISPYVPPVLYNDVARSILGVSDVGNPGHDIAYRGAGEMVGIADTGIDLTHPDLAGRVKAVGLANPNDPDDYVGHGTHVAGSILGDGSASTGRLKGVAPEATAFFQALADRAGQLVGLPLELGELLLPAYEAGARIHNDSWGAPTAGEYTANSLEIDEFVWDHPDMLIVVAAGNDGSAASPQHSKAGFVDWASVGSPASSKNALTVGASRSSRMDGALAGKTYGEEWPNDFPDPPLSGESVSGDAESVAGFSSRGPCLDQRIKPDVVAPGTDILSTRAKNAPAHEYWGLLPADDSYAFMGGTSMAAPLVAGCAALVREFYVKDRSVDPSAALLKATLIAGARWLSGADAIADFATFPNFNQGFGLVDVASSMPNPAEPALRLVFVDSWKDTKTHFVRTGQRFRFSIDVGAGLPLRICLAYTDAPARSLQNDLSLIVQDSRGTKLVGNADVPFRLGVVDTTNNVEVIRVVAPSPGPYLIQVMARNLLVSPQPFALVVTGALGSELTREPG